MTKYAPWLITVIACIVAVFSVMKTPEQAAQMQPQTAQKAPEVQGEAKVDAKPPKVAVYKESAKKKTKLPDRLKEDAAIAVLDSSRIEGSDRPTTVTTVINTDTGEVETVQSKEPLPWLTVKSRNELKLTAGINQSGVYSGGLLFSHEFGSIKALNFGMDAAIYTGGAGHAGVSVSYRF